MIKIINIDETVVIMVYFMSSRVKWAFFGTSFEGPRVPKKAQFTHARVEHNVLLFDEPLNCL
jgi:hypothetical protein